jgi:hypothetical protein
MQVSAEEEKPLQHVLAAELPGPPPESLSFVAFVENSYLPS